MAVHYTAAFRTELKEQIRKACVDGTVYTRTTACNTLAKIIVLYLTDAQIPFKVLAMGAGVKKITTEVATCPKCRGLGKC